MAIEEFLTDPLLQSLYLWKGGEGLGASHTLPQVKKKCVYFLKEKQYCEDILNNKIKFAYETWEANVSFVSSIHFSFCVMCVCASFYFMLFHLMFFIIFIYIGYLW